MTYNLKALVASKEDTHTVRATIRLLLMHCQAHIHNPYPEMMPYQLLADSGMVHVVPSRTLKVLGCECSPGWFLI